jgi:hypothetical protein
MFNTTARTLKILAGIVWYGGSISLIVKAWRLLAEACAVRPDSAWPWGIVVMGLLVGSLKARYLFSGFCEKNLQRINSLGRPKIWQFYRKRFFFFLLLMILLGISLSRMAHDQYLFLLSVALLDLSIGVALMGSGYLFWKR